MTDKFNQAVALADASLPLARLLNQAPDVQVVLPPTQVWAIKDHSHSIEGIGSDIAVLAYNENDARGRLIGIIKQRHHSCLCETCRNARKGLLPEKDVKLVRVK